MLVFLSARIAPGLPHHIWLIHDPSLGFAISGGSSIYYVFLHPVTMVEAELMPLPLIVKVTSLCFLGESLRILSGPPHVELGRNPQAINALYLRWPFLVYGHVFFVLEVPSRKWTHFLGG